MTTLSILEAFNNIEKPDFLLNSQVLFASGYEAVESLLIETKEVQTLANAPEDSLPFLKAKLEDPTIPDKIKIVYVVTLGKIGTLQSAQVLLGFVESLSDDLGKKAELLGHPYRYSLLALQRITKDKDLFERSGSWFSQRPRVIQRVRNWLSQESKN